MNALLDGVRRFHLLGSWRENEITAAVNCSDSFSLTTAVNDQKINQTDFLFIVDVKSDEYFVFACPILCG